MKVTKIVTHDQVEQLTRYGWTLVCTIENAQELHTERNLEQPSHTAANGCWVPDRWRTELLAVTKPLFMLERDSEELAREADLEAQLSTAIHARTIATSERDKATERAKDLEQKLARREVDYDRALDDFAKSEERRRKLETDLAKVRTEIGDARWRELVG